MTTESKFKVGDRVLVEAEVVGLTGCGPRVRPACFSRDSGVQCTTLRHIHPFPDPTTPRLIPVDLEAGDGEYPPILPSEMRVGDVVSGSTARDDQRVCGSDNGTAWLKSIKRGDCGSLWQDHNIRDTAWHWLLIQRDGEDQRKAKRLRYCDLLEGKYLVQHKGGYVGLHFGAGSPIEIPPGTRVWRIEFSN